MVKVISFSRTLTDTRKDTVAAMFQGNVVDKLHDDDGLADTCTSKEPDLTTLRVRRKKVDDLDARQELCCRGVHLCECGRRPVDRVESLRLNGAQLINRLTNDVNNPAQRLLTDGNLDWGTSVLHGLSTSEAICPVHGNGADHVLTQVLCNLQNQPVLEALHLQSIEDWRQRTIKLNVDHGTNDLRNLARGGLGCEAAVVPPECGGRSCSQGLTAAQGSRLLDQGAHGLKMALEERSSQQ
mmetsp:Transcript_68823/g.125562  ORF Transcript_68823/g.125562 Transcript_68823/m.125562 type:complete len:240 (+) Transcript_68823:931-1650(+)